MVRGESVADAVQAIVGDRRTGMKKLLAVLAMLAIPRLAFLLRRPPLRCPWAMQPWK